MDFNMYNKSSSSLCLVIRANNEVIMLYIVITFTNSWNLTLNTVI